MKSQKQILIEECDVNRARLLEDWQTIAGEIHELSNRAKNIGSLASVAVVIATGIFAIPKKKSEPETSWFKTGLKVAQSVSSIWLAFRARARSQSDI